MSRCPLCGGRILYQGFHALECATSACKNGRAVAADVAPGPPSVRLTASALGVVTGQQWMEVATGQLYEVVGLGSQSVDLDATFLPTTTVTIRRTVNVSDIADPAKWRCVSPSAQRTTPRFLPALRRSRHP